MIKLLIDFNQISKLFIVKNQTVTAETEVKTNSILLCLHKRTASLTLHHRIAFNLNQPEASTKKRKVMPKNLISANTSRLVKRKVKVRKTLPNKTKRTKKKSKENKM